VDVGCQFEAGVEININNINVIYKISQSAPTVWNMVKLGLQGALDVAALL